MGGDRNNPKGYVIQLYQYAIRYAYNNDQFISYFNGNIDDKSFKDAQNADYLVLGDFDLIEINPINYFRQYHDVSPFAKRWVGKRQCMLLYDISENGTGSSSDQGCRLFYRSGKKRDGGGWDSGYYANTPQKKFFCLSMLSLTNEVSSKCDDIGKLLLNLRRTILRIVDDVNKTEGIDVHCDVFGTFNTSELAIVWLCDEYVDILQMIGYVKHISFSIDNGEENKSKVNAFMSAFSVISIQMRLELDKDYDIRGDALVQISFNDEMASIDTITALKNEIKTACMEDSKGFGSEDGLSNYDVSVGEFDWIIRCPARTIFKLLNPKNHFKKLHPGQREKNGRFIDTECRMILHNNTRLLMGDSENKILYKKLENYKGTSFLCVPVDFLNRNQAEEKDIYELLVQNRNYYYAEESGLREQLKVKISATTGIVDTMDLLITDYQSVISTAYSKVWAEDIHVQFSAVLYAISSLLNNHESAMFWDRFRDLTNAFKQQIYHLTQSSRLFFEIPSCHLRATGHYDFLMHAYYGIVKKVIEAVYFMQGDDAQSDLVPLLTVNTEPQVKSELFFQFEKDTVRTINLIIPNSVLTDPYRGIFYLAHELFHYSVPQNRTDRNYRYGSFMFERIFRLQIMVVLNHIALNGCPEEIISDTNILFGHESSGDKEGSPYWLLDEKLISFIMSNKVYSIFEDYISSSDHMCPQNALRSDYGKAVMEFAGSDASNNMFSTVCRYAFHVLIESFKEFKEKHTKFTDTQLKAYEWVNSRITYYLNLPEEQFERKVCLDRFSEQGDLRVVFNKEMHLYKGVLEAYSDIAAITLTGFTITDYLIFFIQNVYDCDRVYSMDSIHLDDNQILRCSLVMHYYHYQVLNFGIKKEERERFVAITEEEAQLFEKQYVWAFIKNKERPSEIYKDNEDIERLRSEAKSWISQLKKYYSLTFSNFGCFCDSVFFPILNNANIIKRENDLENSSNSIIKGFGNSLNAIRQMFTMINEEYREIKSILSVEDENSYSEYINKIFDENIKVIQSFQTQISLFALNKMNTKVIDTYKSIEGVDYKYPEFINDYQNWDKNQTVYKAYSWEELQFYIKHCNNRLSVNVRSGLDLEKPYTQLWYRGETNIDYHLQPTLLRDLSKKKSHYNTCVNTRERYEYFKTQCDGTPEMSSYGDYSDIDYLALMQHYGVNTNLLDFTDNVFIALYLALKYFSEEEIIDDAEKAKSKQRDVVLWLFNPALYNTYRRAVLENYLQTKRKEEGSDSIINTKGRELLGLESTKLHGIIPNMSIPHNAELYARYTFGKSWMDERYNDVDETADKEKDESKNNDSVPPLAIWTPRLNHRIKTQSGSFVAFDVYTNAKNFRTLDQVQEYFLELDEAREPFLYKIVIDRSCCNSICDALKVMGLTRRFVYPELEQVKYHFSVPKEKHEG